MGRMVLCVRSKSMSFPWFDSRLSAMPSLSASATLASVPRYCEVSMGSPAFLWEMVCEALACCFCHPEPSEYTVRQPSSSLAPMLAAQTAAYPESRCSAGISCLLQIGAGEE